VPEDSAATIAGKPEHHTSESEEMYLLTLALAEEEGRSGPCPVAGLAERLGVSVASANEMIRKLERRGLLSYEPYRGTSLTPDGRSVALRVLRVRRLWSHFLAGPLGLAPRDADSVACRLEHVTPGPVADRLAEFLGDPATGSLGHPIPPAAGTSPPRPVVPLPDLGAGSRAEVVAVGDGEAAAFLARHGIRPGEVVAIEAAGPQGVLVSATETVDLGPAVAAVVLARRIDA
jgi:DtxR family Mn-dependent transcriptional regulator